MLIFQKSKFRVEIFFINNTQLLQYTENRMSFTDRQDILIKNL